MSDRRPSGMSRQQRARYMRQWRAARGAVTRDYDSDSDKYVIHPESLRNLDIGRANKHHAAVIRRNTIRRLMVKGLSAADIVIATGYGRATVYRHMAMMTDPLLM